MMKNTSQQSRVERLIELLTEQRDHYQRLRRLSEQQRSLICGDRPEQLLSILQERQALVNALTRLNAHLAPFRREWDEMYAALPETARHAAGTLLTEINAALQVILQNDQQDGDLLAAKKQLVADELSELGGSRAASAAYARAAGTTAAGIERGEVAG